MVHKYPCITVIYDRYKKASPTKKAVLEIRITYNYKQKYISTGIFILPNQWRRGKIVNIPNAKQLNETIDNLIADISKVISSMEIINLMDIPRLLDEMHKPKINFINFCKQRASIRKYGKTKDSQERYARFLKFFVAWGNIVEFSDITDANIIAYDQYLTSTGMKPYSKWNNYHRFLNSFIMDAINEGLLTRNPYKWVNIEKGKDSKGLERCLTPEEFKALASCPMPTKHVERARDLFIFQTYTCLSYADLRDFDPKDIVTIKGTQVYTGKRKKTNIPFTIPLLPQALAILSKYNYILPIISNVKYNEYLKVAVQAAGIDKPVSTHWARHTGATLLLNEGIDMKIISKICGHSSTKITEQIYAKLLDETIVDAISKLGKDK